MSIGASAVGHVSVACRPSHPSTPPTPLLVPAGPGDPRGPRLTSADASSTCSSSPVGCRRPAPDLARIWHEPAATASRWSPSCGVDRRLRSAKSRQTPIGAAAGRLVDPVAVDVRDQVRDVVDLLALQEVARKQSALVRDLATAQPALLAGSTDRRQGVPARQRQAQRRLTAEQAQRLVAEYEAGASMKELAARWCLHRTTVAAQVRQVPR